jgi:branched-chain amino acid transport system permease protein
MLDTLGRAYLPQLVGLFVAPGTTSAIAASLSSMLIYLVMTLALIVRPEGLFSKAR